jgi:hypothetical protein
MAVVSDYGKPKGKNMVGQRANKLPVCLYNCQHFCPPNVARLNCCNKNLNKLKTIKCSAEENMVCPSCNKEVEIKKLNSEFWVIKCTNGECDELPELIAHSREMVLKIWDNADYGITDNQVVDVISDIKNESPVSQFEPLALKR